MREICQLNCVHKDKCNKKFNECINGTAADKVHIAAQCGRYFYNIETKEPNKEKK